MNNETKAVDVQQVTAPVSIVCRGCGKPAMVSRYQAMVRKHMRCNTCVSEQRKANRKRRNAEGRPIKRSKERAAEYEAKRSKDPATRARRASDMSRYAKDPAQRFKHEARWKVRRAIAVGRLIRQPCEKCGAEPAHGHHDDYSKPLEVRWLCPTHHREHHANCGAMK